MSEVVTVLSWTGWIWTGLFLLVAGPMLMLRRRRRDPVPPDAEGKA